MFLLICQRGKTTHEQSQFGDFVQPLVLIILHCIEKSLSREPVVTKDAEATRQGGRYASRRHRSSNDVSIIPLSSPLWLSFPDFPDSHVLRTKQLSHGAGSGLTLHFVECARLFFLLDQAAFALDCQA